MTLILGNHQMPQIHWTVSPTPDGREISLSLVIPDVGGFVIRMTREAARELQARIALVFEEEALPMQGQQSQIPSETANPREGRSRFRRL